MPTNPKTLNKSPCNSINQQQATRNANQSSMSPMRQFPTNLDQQNGVQSTMGNGLITASPLMARQPHQTSATRIGVRSSHKRKEVTKAGGLVAGSTASYMQTIQQSNAANVLHLLRAHAHLHFTSTIKHGQLLSKRVSPNLPSRIRAPTQQMGNI